MSKTLQCKHCGLDFEFYNGKPGKKFECLDCHEEVAERYTGNMIYDHKCGATIQINTDPKLTAYINNSTKLRNKGSNLGNNLKVSGNPHTKGACLMTAGGKFNAKGRL